MLIMRWAVMLLLLAAGVAFAYFAATGQQRYKRFGLVIIKWIGIAYLLWLAYHTFVAGPINSSENFEGATFTRGAILRFINVKVILYCITSMSTVVLPYESNPLVISLWALLMAILAFVATCIWSAFGSIFRTLFSDHYRLVNTIMALLLVYCAWSLY